MGEEKDRTLLGWLGLKGRLDISRARWLGAAVSVLVILLFLMAIAAAFAMLAHALFDIGLGTERGGFGTGAVTVALLGAPFVIWRAVVAQKLADTQAESLFNEKINTAAIDLAYRRQVTRAVAPGGSYQLHQDFWEDDLVTRAAAIDRLEGLAHERPDAAPRIARQLSIYVRELSREYPAQDPPKDAPPDTLRGWAAGLTPARPDMEKAAQSLGRLQEIDNAPLAPGDIDLREANLQGFDLEGLSFAKALFKGTRMEGAYLFMVHFEMAKLFDAHLEGASLFGAHLDGVRLLGAHLEGAHLIGAYLKGANLNEAHLEGAYISMADLDETTILTDASFRGAAVRNVDETTIKLLRPVWADIFADGSVPMPLDDPDRPAHWPRQALETEEFFKEWRKWQADPDTYTPPDPPDEAG